MDIFKAIEDNDIYRVRELIDHVNDINKYGDTALMYAACIGHLEIVKLLLSRGADINAINKYGNIALTCAAYNRHLEIVKVIEEFIENEKRKIEFEDILEGEKFIFIKKICGLSFIQYLKIEILF